MQDGLLMANMPMVIFAIVLAVSILAAAIAAVVRCVSKRNIVSISVGAFAIPAMILNSLWYWLLTTGVEGPPTGAVVTGTIRVLALSTPFALLTSYMAVSMLRRAEANEQAIAAGSRETGEA